MAFLDIERIINQDNIGSRFKLVHLASLRAKELNEMASEETSASPALNAKPTQKVTSRALCDIVYHRVTFEELEPLPEEKDETKGE